MIIDEKFFETKVRVLLDVNFDTIQGRNLQFFGMLEKDPDGGFELGDNFEVEDPQVIWFKEDDVKQLSWLTKTIILKYSDTIGFCLSETRPVYKPIEGGK